MSQYIINEVMFLLRAFFMGIIITASYDGFLILRKLIKHSRLFVSAEDFFFWIVCAGTVFYVLNEESNGTLRWFAVAGAGLGMLLYKKTLSSLIIYIMSTFFQRIFCFFFKTSLFLFKPIRFAGKKIYRMVRFLKGKIRKVGKYMKNKLTYCLKLLKITLCKH